MANRKSSILGEDYYDGVFLENLENGKFVSWQLQDVEKRFNEIAAKRDTKPKHIQDRIDRISAKRNIIFQEIRGRQPQGSNERYEHPDTMDNAPATILWLIAMGVSILFKGGWVLCILETIIWYKHITRWNKK